MLRLALAGANGVAIEGPTMNGVYAAIQRLDGWIEAQDWRAYDPFDGLNAWLRPLAIGKLGRQLLLQGCS